MRRAGLLSSSVLVACGLVVAVERQLYLPALPDWAVAGASTVLAVFTIALALAKAVFTDNLHMEFHDGQLHVEWVPTSGTTCKAEAVEVRVRILEISYGTGIQPDSRQSQTELHVLHGCLPSPCILNRCQRWPTACRCACAGTGAAVDALPHSALAVGHTSVITRESCLTRGNFGRGIPTAW